MKTLVLLLLFLSASTIASCQIDSAKLNDSSRYEGIDLTPGTYLQKAAKNEKIAGIFQVSALVITGLGVANIGIKNTVVRNSAFASLFSLSGLCIIMSWYEDGRAWKNIGRAGLSMDKRGVGFDVNPKGASLFYKF